LPDREVRDRTMMVEPDVGCGSTGRVAKYNRVRVDADLLTVRLVVDERRNVAVVGDQRGTTLHPTLPRCPENERDDRGRDGCYRFPVDGGLAGHAGVEPTMSHASARAGGGAYPPTFAPSWARARRRRLCSARQRLEQARCRPARAAPQTGHTRSPTRRPTAWRAFRTDCE
jgi:hypothetical protein